MSDFTKSLTAMLAKHRKKPILWYDINKSYYHKGETVMSWLPGEFPRCIDKTKEQGIDLIVTPQFKYYLARTQMKFPADDVRARPGGAPILLKDCYNFDPRNGRDKNDVKHIKGINLCMWAEWIPSGELLMYMTYPRAMAVSETAWGSHKNRPSLEEFERKWKPTRNISRSVSAILWNALWKTNPTGKNSSPRRKSNVLTRIIKRASKTRTNNVSFSLAIL